MTTVIERAPSLIRGKFRFKDPELARIAATLGAEEAWRAGFARFGPGVTSVVEGQFAVHLKDAQGRSFAVVDRFAIHPLCYRFDGKQLHVAERADALADPNTVVDPQAIFDYLYFHVIPAPRTIFSGIKRLPAGHYALFDKERLTIQRWWNPGFVEGVPGQFDDLRLDFTRLLRESVRRSLGDQPTGCFLSGGTDSSTVAGIVTEITGHPARTYSIGFDAKGYDEMEYARIAARHFGTDHHEYYVTANDVVQSIEAIATSYDQPFGNSSVLPAYYCAKMARENGTDLMLAGDGGDELFGGNTRYAKQRVFDLYGRIPESLRRAVLEPMLAGSRLSKRVPGIKKAASYVEQARCPMPDRMQMYNLLLRLGLDNILTLEFLETIDVEGPLRQQRNAYAASSAQALINRMLAYDWKYTLADNDLPKVVGATAQAGLSVAFPLLDDLLVDFSLRLPPHFKLRGTQLRWFFKKALQGFLPDEILAKKKHGFGMPFGLWATEHLPLRSLAFESLDALGRRGIVRPEFIRQLTEKHLPQHPGYYGELVWILMTLEMWLKKR